MRGLKDSGAGPLLLYYCLATSGRFTCDFQYIMKIYPDMTELYLADIFLSGVVNEVPLVTFADVVTF